MLLYVQGEGTAALVLHFQETLCALMLLLDQFAKKKKKKKVAHILPNHIVLVEIEAKREVGVRDPQMHVDQEVEGRLHLLNNSDESGSSWLIGNKKLRLKKMVAGPSDHGQLSG